MIVFQITRDYLHWHYTQGVIDYLHIWGNILHFFYTFFSIALLLKTLLSPWRRMQDETQVGFTDVYDFLSRLVVNVTMRIIGLFVRLIFILFGILFITIALIVGLGGFLIWFLLPLGIFVLFAAGFNLLVS